MLPLTSLVPTIVEITSFVEQNWPHVWWFPNWYLGIPLRFVTGPVVPTLIILLRRLTSWPVEQAYLVLIGGIWVIGGIGVAQLTKALGGGKRVQWWSAVIFLLLPFHLLLLSYGSGLHHLAIAILPWVFWSWMRAMRESGGIREIGGIWTAGLAALVLLIDVSGLLPLLIGVIALTISGDKENWGNRGVKSVLFLLTAFSLATIWYTPRFWWIILGNPSFGGKPLANVIPFILQLVQALIPLILGVWVVQKRRVLSATEGYRLTSKLMQFGLLFGSSFLFLTLIRFLSDVDFWMDWTSYFLELQLALALLLPRGILRLGRSVDLAQSLSQTGFGNDKKKYFLSLFIILILTISNGAVGYRWYRTNETDRTYREKINKMIAERVVPGEPFVRQLTDQGKRVFLSGSPVFWLGSEIARVYDPGSLSPNEPGSLWQVRGGRDEVATHPTWAMGAYQIREGTDPLLLKDWLTVLGISYVLVHEERSGEYFKDFKNTSRFAELIEEEEFAGNILYQTPGTIARLANREILQNGRPKAGNDREALSNYVQNLGEPLAFTIPQMNQLQIDSSQMSENEVISLAVTYDRAWKLVSKKGKVQADALGNMVIVPEGDSQVFQLEYQESIWSLLPGVLFSLVSLALLYKSANLAYLISRVPSLQLTDSSNEEEKY